MFHGPNARAALLAVLLTATAWPGLARSEPAGQADPIGQNALSPSSAHPPLGGVFAAQRTTLDNGLKLVLRVDHGLPQVAVCSTYDAGSRRDESTPGAAALVHRMLREGGRSTSGADYSRQVEARGGRLENTVTEDYARFCTLVPKQEVELALWLEAGRMTEYAFNGPNFEKRSATLRAEYVDSIQGSVHALGLRRLNEIAFERYAAYERVEPANPDDVGRLTLDHVRDFHRDFYHANNAVLSVTGDFDAFQMLDLVKRHLGDPALRGNAPKDSVDGASRQTSPRLSVVMEPTAKSSMALYGWVTPAPGHPDHAALAVANSILGEGDASLLYQQLVEQQHLATGVHAWMTRHAGPELFAIEVDGKPEARLDLIERGLNDVVARIARGAPLPEASVEAAKRRVLQRRLELVSSNLGAAQYLGEHELLSAGPPEAALKNIEAVTAEDVRRVVLEQLRPERRTSIEVYPKEWQDPNQTVMPRFHIVSSGENLTLIAKRHGSTPQALAKLNGINEKQAIFPGQKLRVPATAKKQSAATKKQSDATKSGAPKKKEAFAYQVRKGDSLSSIAARHDISVAALLRANRIDPKKPLQLGQRLAIPVPP